MMRQRCSRRNSKTPLQIGQHLVRAFEAGFEMGQADRRRRVEAVLSISSMTWSRS